MKGDIEKSNISDSHGTTTIHTSCINNINGDVNEEYKHKDYLQKVFVLGHNVC